MATDCVFCQIADQDIPAPLVYNDELLVAIRDLHPVAPVHILIIPKKHIPDLLHITDVDADMLGKIIEVATMLARREGIAETGFRLVTNTGPDAGQSIAHIHFHLLGGRKMNWPPG